ncbi:ParB family protein [Leifsonia sp. SIMBA_070]|uniref:ParB family protein n=1 Tax=Leifsonia sp. SIMBA_070 TaxID=3085810 RepID=UPI00397E7005
MDHAADSHEDDAAAPVGDAEPEVARAAPAEPAKPVKKRTTVTFYLTDAMRNRARAAYRQTSWDERDTSWSEMLNKALLAEVQRRERAYNGGRVFVGNDKPLTPGRPIGF